MDTLHEIREEAREQLEENLGVIAYGLPLAEIRAACEATTELFQAMASSSLLLNFDVEGYRKHLVFSGYSQRYFLNRWRAEGNLDNEYLAISRTEAFFNVLVARHRTLAAEIVAASPDVWIADGEYEDDYCYFAFLHHFAVEPDQANSRYLSDLNERFERSLEGATSPRLAVCRAFLGRDAQGFEDAFEALLTAHEDWIRSHEKYRAFDPVFLMRCRLFVEGVALLQVAERLDFPVQSEYQFCPSIARLPQATSWPPDIFQEIERVAVEERRQRAVQGR